MIIVNIYIKCYPQNPPDDRQWHVDTHVDMQMVDVGLDVKLQIYVDVDI